MLCKILHVIPIKKKITDLDHEVKDLSGCPQFYHTKPFLNLLTLV